jgi:hypothetical protein
MGDSMSKAKRVALALAAAAALTIGVAGSALADGPAGNSGHSSNGSTQCQSDGQNNPNCPPFGGGK